MRVRAHEGNSIGDEGGKEALNQLAIRHADAKGRPRRETVKYKKRGCRT